MENKFIYIKFMCLLLINRNKRKLYQVYGKSLRKFIWHKVTYFMNIMKCLWMLKVFMF